MKANSLWKDTFLIYRRLGWLLLPLSYAGLATDQWLMGNLQTELMSSDGAGASIWLWGGSSFLLSLILPTIETLLILAAVQSQSVVESLRRFTNQYFVETLRAMGKTLSWSFLFIVPGLVRYAQFQMVPFVVMLDPHYSRGEVDALKESTRLVNRNVWKIIGIALLFSAFFPLLLTEFDEWKIVLKNPLSALFFVFIDQTLTIVMILLLRRIWEKNHGTDV